MTDDVLLQTPLHSLHLEAGAKMVPFAGYAMPVQYPLGVKKEHLHTRSHAGLFDVSHMGQIMVFGDDAVSLLESLIPIDVEALAVGKQKYGLFTSDTGGILDDLMVARLSDTQFLLVVNAATKAADYQHLLDHSASFSQVTVTALDDRALLALQGPHAVDVLASVFPDVTNMRFMDVVTQVYGGESYVISRSGYTGEDGFEILLPATQATDFAKQLLSFEACQWIGLGARDSLRLEAGLCLYGHDINASTTPIEASLSWAISPSRRTGGSKSGGFIGADIILAQSQQGELKQKRVGLIGEAKAPVREGCVLFDHNDQQIGQVTSGTSGPTIGKPISMGYVDAQHAQLGSVVFAEVRGKKLPMTVSKMPFVPANYYRGE